jgi:adenine C2-methylase RlmN of 23S rRNA A2503 and tRNA A37
MIGYGAERDYLFSKTSRNVEDEIEMAKSLSRQGDSQRAIAEKMNLSLGKVNGLLNNPVSGKDSDVQNVQTVHPFGSLNKMNVLNDGEEIAVKE